MDSLNITFTLIVCFSASLASGFVLRKLAMKIDLVDTPDDRKMHVGRIPLIGGMTIFIGVAAAFMIFPNLGREIVAYLIAGFLIVTVGLMDDRFDLKISYRLAIQCLASLAVIIGGVMSIESLGEFGSLGSVQLGVFSIPFTVFSIMVAMNAFNFIDGIDGLSGLLFMIAMFAMIALCMLENGISINNYLIPLVFFVAIIPYMAFNLGLLGSNYRVFLGDAGSMLLGLTVAWLLINYTQQGNSEVFSPVTALWIIAIPLMDMLTVVIRRAVNRKSPLSADRNHLHHLFLDRGFSDRHALISIGFLGLAFAVIGILTEVNEVSQSTMLSIFLIIFAIYYHVMSHLQKHKIQTQ